ncbi:thiamine pyrophosphate-requiring protein [Variovorax sp. Sphag1AA]|uniref:thiamine pyrophosphate-requiring protein n=1 Tax=Variovorax sp. Sphag1AA TaxID=2587027 RepID=UPI00161CDD0F|nr:thiamine pyrophosphate-requiring protein [Variovorax sp. Sphag1AA]MBB3177979.1 acetolactate synthase-1/2/3 large subunit [Variovorax sp. Sphag1AA]
MTARTTAHYFLEGLREAGAEYLFANMGTDHATLIEEMARQEAEGTPLVRTLLCPHENTAVHMALGYAMVTGRGQAVLVHVDVGTANAAMGLHNALRTRLPVLLVAGRAPYTSHGELPGTRDNYVHFIQEPFDQAGLVRPYVKWEADLPSGVMVKEILHRAHSVMSSDPPGPAYLTLRRETLAEQWDESRLRANAQVGHPPHRLGGADPASIERIADRLLAARAPLIITSYAGRNAAVPERLARLAELIGARVVEANPLVLNMPRTHACFAGFSANGFLPDTDVGILLDVDVPWIPSEVDIAPDSHWIQVDVDPLKNASPMWPYAVHQRMMADSGRVLEQLTEVLQRRMSAGFAAEAAQRARRYADEAAARREAAAAAAASGGQPGAIAAPYLCAAIARHLPEDALLLNEAVRTAPTVCAQIPRTRAGTYAGNGGGGLGWSAGFALGAKLAAPEREVVRIVGDGAFYFGNPSSTFATARQYGLPTLTVLVDNAGWAAVKTATARVHPDGYARRQDQFQSRLANGVAFTQIAEAAGAFGLAIDDPEQVDSAIARCLQEVRAGRSALLHARITPL